MLCTAFPTEKTDALLAMSTRFRNPKRLLQSGSLIKSAYLQCIAQRSITHAAASLMGCLTELKAVQATHLGDMLMTIPMPQIMQLVEVF